MNRLIKYQVDSDQIVHLIFDRPDSSANLMDAEFAEELQSTVERIVSDSKATGVIIRSAKQTFFAGADLEALIKIEKKDAETVFNNVEKLKNSLRLLETSGKPVVAALNGSALGGGWEIRTGRQLVDEQTIETMNERTNWGDLLETEELQPDKAGKLAPAPDW